MMTVQDDANVIMFEHHFPFFHNSPLPSNLPLFQGWIWVWPRTMSPPPPTHGV